jgi:adenosylmethionine-8-amino-7-oxononanoate aminotransferase
VLAMGTSLGTALRQRLGDNPYVGDIRGRGLFWGVELVADRASKEPLDSELAIHHVIKAQAMARGLMCYPGGGTIDGKRGNHILLAPPYIIQQTHVSEIADKLAASIDAALREVGL